MTNKTRFILAGIVLLILINTLFFALGYYFYLHPILGDFEILNMTYSNENLTLSLSKANNALCSSFKPANVSAASSYAVFNVETVSLYVTSAYSPSKTAVS